MEVFFNMVDKVNKAVNDFVWGPPMLVFLVGIGIFVTIGTGFFQVSHFGLWMKKTFLAIFSNKTVRDKKDPHAISQFQSLTTALAGTIGTGNIVGVATAIVSGGPGAVFWMWVSAFFGMMTNYTENVLGILFRYKNNKGQWMGGPMVYLERGLHCKPLAVLFAIFATLASFGIGNMTQANGISTAISGALRFTGIDAWYLKAGVGVGIMLLAALVILGGIKRIAAVTEKIVPFMALAYLAGGIYIIAVNGTHIPAAFGSIFTNAFSFEAVGGGIFGYVIMNAMRYGVARGVFSNEAGLGSSVMVHSASNVKEPVVQGMWGVFEVFADTLIVCTITALSILCTGVVDMHTGVNADGLKGASLAQAAFAHGFGSFGSIFIAVAITLFAFSTILGWSYYGERAVEYLFGTKYLWIYKVLFIGLIVVGCTASLDLVWNISDTFNGLMAIPNLIGVAGLSGLVFKATKDYLQRHLDDPDAEEMERKAADFMQQKVK